ncbi:MAG: zinc ribbon domain-containing protein [Patescibacteria group bacterium]|nr:zinc ribbon domain-containing protein [Patescibacteria group bacterium]MCL5224185.1 zinc ribbon domain-containing protein [Patescibacteria group bacterium]
MDENQPVAVATCPKCHQSVLPQYYFCPNCGQALREPPLPTSALAQIKLYAFTLILMPLTCYLIYRRWLGVKYLRSQDPKARQIGIVSMILLIVSVALVIWLIWAAIIWAEQYVQAQENSLNSLSGL